MTDSNPLGRETSPGAFEDAMKVKMLESVGTAEGGYAAGQVYDLPETRAIEFISVGWAERAEFHPDQPEACVKPECCRAAKKGARR